MAPGLRGPRGRGARSGSSSSRRSRGAQLGGRCASGARPAAPPSLPVACAAWCHRAAAAPSSGRRTSPAPRAPHTNFCPASPTCARASDLRSRGSARRAVRVAAEAAPPRGEDLAPVALVPRRLGGRRLAARQRPAAPAGHGSVARALQDSGESGPCAPPPRADRGLGAAGAFPSAKGRGARAAGRDLVSCPKRSAAGTLSPETGTRGSVLSTRLIVSQSPTEWPPDLGVCVVSVSVSVNFWKSN